MVGYHLLKYSLFKSIRNGSVSRGGIFKEFVSCNYFVLECDAHPIKLFLHSILTHIRNNIKIIDYLLVRTYVYNI